MPGAEHPFRGRPLNTLTWPELFRQYLLMLQREHSAGVCQYLYFCTSKASKLRLSTLTRALLLMLQREYSAGVSICTFVLVKQVN